MKNVIFYFSGTGNSLQVAKDIAIKIGECDVINIVDYDVNKTISYGRVGFVFPVYFWGVPNIIKDFIRQIKIDNEPYIFSVVTCGVVGGASLIQVNDLLVLKNKKLHSGFIIIMPENYIVMYNPPNKEVQEKLFNNEKDKIEIISNVIIDKKEQALEKSKYVIDRLTGKLLNRLVVKKFKTRDKNFNVNDSCISCGKCERVCSIGNITMINRKPTWDHNCEFCMACIQNCPTKAINYKNKTQKRRRYINPNI